MRSGLGADHPPHAIDDAAGNELRRRASEAGNSDNSERPGSEWSIASRAACVHSRSFDPVPAEHRIIEYLLSLNLAKSKHRAGVALVLLAVGLLALAQK